MGDNCVFDERAAEIVDVLSRIHDTSKNKTKYYFSTMPNTRYKIFILTRKWTHFSKTKQFRYNTLPLVMLE